MTSTWGSRLAQTSQRIGLGVQLAPTPDPKELPIGYSSFRQGLMLADRPADVPVDFYSRALDVETSRRDGVIRSPGITQLEDTAHSLQWMAIHASLDFQSVLVAFDPPYVGVREAGNFVWTNVALDSSGSQWVTSIYGDVLLISNGRKSYYRNFDTQAIVALPQMPGAGTLFTAFGRAFAGATLSGGDLNVLGIMWNGLTGDFTDWTGDGSGAELLLADAPHGDRIVAGRVLSYDIAGILCRRSLWIAQRTEDPFRPADFRFRILGVGCVAEPTAKTTEGGITFLSDEGVRHFDGQSAPIVSSAINSELLPLDFTQIAKYKSEWDGDHRRYILTTPTAVYTYQFPIGDYPKGAWFKRGAIVTNVIAFAQQVVDPTWDDFLIQTWDALTGAWFDYATPETNTPAQMLFASGTKVGYQDPTAFANFGVALAPLFEPRPTERAMVDNPDQIITTQGFLIDYAGSGTIEMWAPNESGVMTLQFSKVLPAAVKVTSKWIDSQFSSQATGIEVRIVAGTPEIFRIRQHVLSSGITLVGI